MYNDLVSSIERLFTEIKKMTEQQKIAEEQERLRRIQVSDRWYAILPFIISVAFMWYCIFAVYFVTSVMCSCRLHSMNKQEEMEKERKRKEEEERRLREEEQMKKQYVRCKSAIFHLHRHQFHISHFTWHSLQRTIHCHARTAEVKLICSVSQSINQKIYFHPRSAKNNSRFWYSDQHHDRLGKRQLCETLKDRWLDAPFLFECTCI